MPARKRTRDEVEEIIEVPTPPQDGMLVKLRNTWEFANLMQYIFIFGKAVKIDEDFDIEVRINCPDLKHANGRNTQRWITVVAWADRCM